MYVGIKDATFEPSSPLRHSTELSKILKEQNTNLPIYTDGGPDHNVSVQLGLISLFLNHDLNMLTAVRTAPCQSWKNRVNCILNIGLQTVRLIRMKMSDTNEKNISSYNTMDEIRKAVQESPGLREGFVDSIEPVKF